MYKKFSSGAWCHQSLLALMLLCFWLAPAQAHKVNIFVFTEADRVFVEGYFTDGKSAMNSEVTATDAAGNVLFSGQTNAEGQIDFPLSASSDINGEIRVELNAGMGHMAEYLLPLDELQAAGDTTDSGAGTDPDGVSGPLSGQIASQGTLQDSSGGGNDRQLQLIVEKAVAKAIKPLARDIAEAQEKASISEIIGGIGYILGLLGIFAYLKARKHNIS